MPERDNRDNERYSDSRSAYDILGVLSDATQEEIGKAFRALGKKYHPSGEDGGNEQLFKEMSEAYQYIKNEERRQDYDARFGFTRVRARPRSENSGTKHSSSKTDGDRPGENQRDRRRGFKDETDEREYWRQYWQQHAHDEGATREQKHKTGHQSTRDNKSKPRREGYGSHGESHAKNAFEERLRKMGGKVYQEYMDAKRERQELEERLRRAREDRARTERGDFSANTNNARRRDDSNQAREQKKESGASSGRLHIEQRYSSVYLVNTKGDILSFGYQSIDNRNGLFIAKTSGGSCYLLHPDTGRELSYGYRTIECRGTLVIGVNDIAQEYLLDSSTGAQLSYGYKRIEGRGGILIGINGSGSEYLLHANTGKELSYGYKHIELRNNFLVGCNSSGSEYLLDKLTGRELSYGYKRINIENGKVVGMNSGGTQYELDPSTGRELRRI